MKKIMAITLCFLSIFSFLGGTAMAANTAKIQGNIGSSKVEIQVKIDSGNEKLKPGVTSKQVVTISNYGANCFLRVSPKFTSEAELEGVRPEWILKNGVYYYKTPVRTGESLQFCSGIKLSEDTTSKNVNAEYFVDAIQSANMIPDYNSDNPWGNVAVTKALDRKSDVLKASKKGSNGDSLELHYNDDAQALISNFDEIFTNMPLLHPGDTYTEVIKLYNPTKTAKTLYMSDDNDNAEILKYVTVGIKSVVDEKTTEIYSGPVLNEGEKTKIDVGTLEPGSSGELIVSAKMDSGVGNEASALSGHLSLTMEATESGKGEAITTNPDTEQKKEEAPIKTRSPQTGEKNFLYKLLLACSVIFAIGALLILSSLRRKEDD